ncbi:hypothetical protein AGMMS50267_18370 [Spirochaetia bacterium]|nr:hypothetical protein AGMMS50267_18370 [Spirochaetia bacterium]
MKGVYAGGQYAVAYTIPNIGLARVQYVGPKIGPDNVAKEWFANSSAADFEGTAPDYLFPRIEAAFAFTGAENITIDAGLKYWLPATVNETTVTGANPDGSYIWADTGDKIKFNHAMNVSVGANLAFGDIGLLARVDTAFAGKEEATTSGVTVTAKEGFGLDFYVTPSYDLGFAKVGLDLGLNYKGASTVGDTDQKDNTVALGTAVWISKALSHGFIKTGVAFKLPMAQGDKGTGTAPKSELVLTIPIVIEAEF